MHRTVSKQHRVRLYFKASIYQYMRLKANKGYEDQRDQLVESAALLFYPVGVSDPPECGCVITSGGRVPGRVAGAERGVRATPGRRQGRPEHRPHRFRPQLAAGGGSGQVG